MKIEEFEFLKNKNAICKALKYALKSDFYSRLYEENGVLADDIQSYEDFKKIPCISKAAYCKNRVWMISDSVKRNALSQNDILLDCNGKIRKLYEQNGFFIKITSGSTGKPVEIIKSQSDIRREYIGLNFARKMNLGTLPSGNYVWIWPANPEIRKYFYSDSKISVYRDSKYGYKYMISEYSDVTFRNLHSFILQNNISWITAPPSMLCLFAEYLNINKLKIRFNYIECHSEKLFPWQLKCIFEAFECIPASVYSSNEIQFIGMTCNCGKMHLIPNNAFVEIIDDEQGKNQVIVTSLCAYELPIIRYRIGDLGKWDESPCKCNITTPILDIKGYRQNDYLKTEDGRNIEPFLVSDLIILINNLYKVSIEEYTVKQTDWKSLLFYLKKDAIERIKNRSEILSYIIQYFENTIYITFDVQFEDIDKLREQTGTRKFKYFIGFERNKEE